jgi:hypothetical protein
MQTCTQCNYGNKCASNVPDTYQGRYDVGKPLTERGCDGLNQNSPSISVAESVPGAGLKGVPIKGGVYMVQGVPGSGCYMYFPKEQQCKSYPHMTGKGIIDDSKVGGPPPSDKASCDARGKSWTQSCGFPMQSYFFKK